MSDSLFAPQAAPSSIPVSEIVRRARTLLESSIGLCWVSGEISSLTRAASGHVYFTLKDDAAQIRCVMWRTRAQLLPFQLREGMQVDVRAQITLYEPRGDLQLSVESIRRAGQGNLYEAFLRLKAKLDAEGLFAPERKRPLPAWPRGVGVVTSLAGAALHDVLSTLRRRAPALPVVVYPTAVQGDGVGEQIARVIFEAGARCQQDGIDVLIVCRGGGSMEDLWGFNHEAVVRAIHVSPIAVISGVGHETDTTLCDFVADMRAATPTAAAEAVSAGYVDARTRLPALARALQRAGSQRLNQAWQRVDVAQRRLLHPRERLARSAMALDKLALRLDHAQGRVVYRLRTQCADLSARLSARRPRIETLTQRLDNLGMRMQRCTTQRQTHAQARLAALATHLDHLNPEAVLTRGYAIARDMQGRIIRNVGDVAIGDGIRVRVADGTLDAHVMSSNADDRLSRTDDTN
ncbi:MAG: exodeoxyribonuclease VII large subunit [Rhodocyclaceae bacterium]|jgi:exodeoxyribonuclease VII large subunit